MKNIFLLAASLLIALAGCQQTASVDLNKAKQDLLNADKAWNDNAQKLGEQKATESIYTDSILALYPDLAPIMGLDAVKSFNKAHPDSGVLSWIPLKAVVASSGDFGYTYGTWQEKSKTKSGDTTVYGVYSDVWTKQADGSWKPIVDHVSTTPKP